MAILVEQEKKPVNWIGGFTVLFIVVALFVFAYLLFFKKPEVLDKVTPKNLENINKISEITIDPEGVINSPAFQGLKTYASPITVTETSGRENPFEP